MPGKKTTEKTTVVESVPEQMRTDAMVEALGDREAPEPED